MVVFNETHTYFVGKPVIIIYPLNGLFETHFVYIGIRTLYNESTNIFPWFFFRLSPLSLTWVFGSGVCCVMERKPNRRPSVKVVRTADVKRIANNNDDDKPAGVDATSASIRKLAPLLQSARTFDVTAHNFTGEIAFNFAFYFYVSYLSASPSTPSYLGGFDVNPGRQNNTTRVMDAANDKTR